MRGVLFENMSFQNIQLGNFSGFGYPSLGAQNSAEIALGDLSAFSSSPLGDFSTFGSSPLGDFTAFGSSSLFYSSTTPPESNSLGGSFELPQQHMGAEI